MGGLLLGLGILVYGFGLVGLKLVNGLRHRYGLGLWLALWLVDKRFEVHKHNQAVLAYLDLLLMP